MSLLVYRLLKWTAIVVLLLALIAFGVFSLFVMNPFEGRLERMDAIVPADLNVFAAKAAAEGDARSVFDSPFWKKLSGTRAFQMWVNSPNWRSSGAYAGLREALAKLNLVQHTYKVDPIAELAGREVGVGLRWRKGQDTPDFLLLTRLGFLARASMAAMQRDMWRSMAEVPVEKASTANVLRLRLQQGSAADDVFLARVRDVLVVSSSEELVARSLALAGGEGSALEARLGARPDDESAPIGVLSSPNPGGLAKTWSEMVVPKGLTPSESLLAKLIDPIGLDKLAGTIHLAQSPHIAMNATLHAGSLNPAQEALAAETVGDLKARLSPYLAVAPRDLMGLVYLHIRPRELGRLIEESLEPDVVELVRDTLGATSLQSLSGLLDRWTGSLETGVCIMLNRQSFEKTTTNPPYPGITLVFRMSDPTLWSERLHHDLWDQLRDPLALDPPDYENPRPDAELMFYNMRANPWGDVSSPGFARLGDLLVFSTSAPFLRAVADVFLEPSRYGLNRTGEVDRLFASARPLDSSAQLFGFIDVRRTLVWMNDMAPFWASAAALSAQLDQAPAKRRNIERQAQSMPSLKDDAAREKWVNDRLVAWSRQLQEELARRTDDALGPFVKHLGVLHQVGFTVAIDKAPTLRLRTTFRLDP